MTERTVSALNHELDYQKQQLTRMEERQEALKWEQIIVDRETTKIKETIQELEAIIIGLDTVKLAS